MIRDAGGGGVLIRDAGGGGSLCCFRCLCFSKFFAYDDLNEVVVLIAHSRARWRATSYLLIVFRLNSDLNGKTTSIYLENKEDFSRCKSLIS